MLNELKKSDISSDSHWIAEHYGIWYMVYGIWYMIYDIWYMSAWQLLQFFCFISKWVCSYELRNRSVQQKIMLSGCKTGEPFRNQLHLTACIHILIGFTSILCANMILWLSVCKRRVQNWHFSLQIHDLTLFIESIWVISTEINLISYFWTDIHQKQ